MSEESWVFDDPAIPDDESLYRRVRTIPDHRTFDAERNTWVPSAAAFRRFKGEGMSVHRETVLEVCGRHTSSLYNPDKYEAYRFKAVIPRAHGAGVLGTPATEEHEPDSDLRAAHAEVRPPTHAEDRRFWSRIRHAMIQACEWVPQTAI